MFGVSGGGNDVGVMGCCALAHLAITPRVHVCTTFIFALSGGVCFEQVQFDRQLNFLDPTHPPHSWVWTCSFHPK